MSQAEAYVAAREWFRLVHGPGDGGSEHAFNCLNPAIQAGWMQLARVIDRRIRRAKPLKITSGNDAMIATMERLRKDGWCVALKCLPRALSWRIEGARSEYDAPCRDRKLGRGKWCVELIDMKSSLKKGAKWRGSPFALADTAVEAVDKVATMVKLNETHTRNHR